jgi:NAD(P)-dependent dehydrogenase (short-subunit alcohol dehydrogenase family)
MAAIAQCQRWSIEQQLQAGVRVLDIRVATLRNNNDISHNVGIWHGRVPGGDLVTTVLQPLVTFVEHNIHETIILQLTPEFGRPFSVTAKERTLALVHQYLGDDLILHARNMPNLLQSTTLGDLRKGRDHHHHQYGGGRILVLVHQRFFCKPDSHHFNATSVLQDYGFGLLDKWVRSLWYNTRHIETLLTYATAEVDRHGRHTRQLHVSQLVLTPGVAGWGDVWASCIGKNSLRPASLAYQLYQRLGSYLCRHVDKNWNIIFLDYIDMGWPILFLSIALNFPIPLRVHWATWEPAVDDHKTISMDTTSTTSTTSTTQNYKPLDVTVPLTTACLCRNRVLYVDSVEQFLSSHETSTALRHGGVLTIVYQVGQEHQVVKQRVAPASSGFRRREQRPIVILSGWRHVCDKKTLTKLPREQNTYQGRPLPRRDPPPVGAVIDSSTNQSFGPSLPYYSNTTFAVLGAVAVLYSLALHLWVYMLCRKSPVVITPLPEPNHPPAVMRQRVAIVTGSNTGIGYETARRLAVDYGMTVVLACRSREKGEQAVRQILQQGGRGAIFLHPLDLSSSQSIQEFCRAVKETFNAVHVLVNNAGRNSSSPDPVEGNRDLLFQTNFVGHFQLTAQLMDVFAPKARVVNLSSVMHHFVEGDVNSPTFWKDCIAHAQSPLATYQPSKLAALLFTIQLNKRFGDRIESVAVNPGGVYVLHFF